MNAAARGMRREIKFNLRQIARATDASATLVRVLAWSTDYGYHA
jgi:hypothetical protein